MAEVQQEHMLRGFLKKHIVIKFSGGDDTRGVLQAFGREGMLITHGDGEQFVPFNQVLTIREYKKGEGER